ncbi:MAG: fumarylacetoacetate hydrolase family protein [Propionibacteriaceae bacterium]|jgi:2-keto-4-pentenoate hydratase/2-oxohepta-3-ene-1,7-dioic acid hydratase in catechol pathway|nr:fumarylacetoacetate hydrolase family protein [Propionibacteriaceae bacterium]
MRIARYAREGQIHYGLVELEADGGPHPQTVADLTGDPLVGPVDLTGARHDLEQVRLLAPVLPRSKVVGLARNWAPEADPPGEDDFPEVFLKPNTSVIGPNDPIVVPRRGPNTVLEGEVAVVIGRICRQLPLQRVPEVVFGYTIANDVTMRDFLAPGGPWGLAKGFDASTPLGPWIVSHLTLAQAGQLELTTSLDADPVQHGSTAGLRWSIERQIAYLSQVMTLLPGDVVLTGTPPGSCRIAPGQVVTVLVEEIGRLANPVVAEV